MSDRIELVGVTHRFGEIEALGRIDLTVDPGETVAVIGPSGCGKTTLLRVIAGLVSPTTGVVRVGDSPPRAARSAKRIGYVPQTPGLLPWRSVADNARLLVDVRPSRGPGSAPADGPAELLAAVGLADFADRYPHELSGGMQQRVSLVRALALEPAVLLLDEPFAALDELTRAEMRHLLAELCEPRGTTVVIVTHSIAEAVYVADRVVVMSPRPGTVVDELAVGLERPRQPALEDDPAFFARQRAVRASLAAGASP